MKTIKRILLSALLLQTVCQPVHAKINVNATKNVISSHIKDLIIAHPFLSFTGLLSIIFFAAYQEYLMKEMVYQYHAESISNNSGANINFVKFADDYTNDIK
jgi:hypothetical protein